MAYTDHFDTVQKLYIAYYQRPADPAGLRFWAQIIDANGGNVKAAVDEFAFSDEAKDLYYANASGITDANIDDVVEAVYTSLFGAVDPDGKDYYVEKFKDGTFTAGTIVLNILDGAAGSDKVAINNKLDVAKKFTAVVDGRALTNPDFGTGSDFNATYDADDVETAREMLAEVTNNPVTVLTTEQVSLFIKGNIANEGDRIIVTNAGGVTYELTTGYDNFQGTSGNDTFVAILGGNSGTIPTLNGTDTLDGKGGRDTLKVDFGTNLPNNLAGASIKNIEVIELSANLTTAINFDTLAKVSGVKEISVNSTGGHPVSVTGRELEAVTVDGVSASSGINVNNTNASGSSNTGESLKEVTLDNFAATATANLRGNAISEVNINSQGVGARAVNVSNARSDALTFNVSNVTGGLTLSLMGSTAADTVTLNGVGSASKISSLTTHSNTKKLNIGGSAKLTFDSTAISSQINRIDASAATGDLDLTITGKNTNVTLGSGSDVLRGSVTSAANIIIDGGDGIDAVDVGLVANAVSPIQFKNFEILDASTGGHNFNIAGFTAINNLDSIILSGGNGTNTLTGVVSGTNLQVKGNNVGSLTLNITGADTNPNDGFEIFLTAEDATVASAKNVRLSFVENVKIHSDGDATAPKNTLELGANNTLTNVTVTGNHDLDLAFQAGNGVGTVKSIDASTFAGKLDVNLANLGVNGTLEVKGGVGDDIFVAATRSDALTGGAGSDQFNLTAAKVTSLSGATPSVLTTIKDFSTGDTIVSGVAGTTSKAAGAEGIGSATTLSAAFTNAFATGLAVGTLHWFYFGGDTYAIFNTSTAGDVAIDINDVVVKLSGIHDLSEAHYTLTSGNLAF